MPKLITGTDIKNMLELNIPQPTIDHTLSERGKRYGSFAQHAEIAQGLKLAMWSVDNWHDRLAPDMQQALEVIADKIARILNGDPNYVDNWHDIQGYAKLVEDRLTKDQNEDSKGLFG